MNHSEWAAVFVERPANTSCGARVQALLETLRTSRSQLNVPALLRKAGTAPGDALELRITTEVIGRLVVLRIEEATPTNQV